ncbi:uncharacterized protein [Procambarus clarkii]|uniref:uncharacterized protein n=1 Tax=Procambarus clarkii TaxID=6728 RepID=UPI003742586D
MAEVRLECGVCRQRYAAKGDLCPRTLFCGHTFCTRCLDRAITSGSRRCLSCSRPFIALSASQLLTDFSILKRVSSRKDDAASSKTPGTSFYNSSLGNSFKPSSGLRSIGTSSYGSKLPTSVSSSSSLQAARTLSQDDSKPMKAASPSTSFETLSTSNHTSRLRNDVSSPSSEQSLDTSSYKLKTLNTDSTPSSLQTDSPKSASRGIGKPSSLPLIGTTSLTYTSLTPRVSSAPATPRSLYGASEPQLNSPSIQKVVTVPDDKIHTDEADSPRSSTLQSTSTEDLPTSRPQTPLTYKFPTIRTRLTIGSQGSRLYRLPSLESDSTDAVQNESPVVGLHDKLKKSSSLPVTALEMPSTRELATATEHSTVASLSNIKANPSVLSSVYKSRGRSAAQLPLTSTVSRIANQDQSLADSKINDHPDMAINGPVSLPPTGSASLLRSVSTPSKFDTGLQNISKDKQAQQTEAGINTYRRELGSDISVLRNTNNGKVEDRGQASSTPSHVLDMCRSITHKSRKQTSNEAASSLAGATKSSPDTRTKNPETLFTSQSNYLKSASSSAQLRSSNSVLTNIQTQTVNSDNDKEKDTESSTLMKHPTVPFHNPVETYLSSAIRMQKTTGTKGQSSDGISSDKEAFQQEAADAVHHTEAGKHLNTPSHTEDESPRADLSLATNAEEFTSSETGPARRSNRERQLSRSMSTGSEKLDESGTRTRPAASRHVGKIARSSSLSARILARSSFVSETINEGDEISTLSRRSTGEISDDRDSAVNKLNSKSSNSPQTSLRARLLSRTSYLSRTMDEEENSITYQRPGKDSIEDSEKVSNSSDLYTKARKSHMEIQKTECENDYSISRQINTPSHSIAQGKTVEDQKGSLVSQSHEILMRINSHRTSEAECVDPDCSDMASDPLALKPTLPTSPPPGADDVLYTDGTLRAATTSHSTGSGTRPERPDHKTREVHSTPYESVLSNRRTPSNANRLGRGTYSRITSTDKLLAELHVGSVPSIQSEDGDDEDTEEDGTPHRHEAKTQEPTENPQKGANQRASSAQHEVKLESVKADGSKLVRGRREHATNEQRDDQAAVQRDNFDDPGICPAPSAGRHEVTGSDSNAKRDNTIVTDRIQKNRSRPMAKDSVQDIWRARNARLRYSLTSRSKQNDSTTDEASEVEAGGNVDENHHRPSHQLHKTTKVTSSPSDLRTDPPNLNGLSQLRNIESYDDSDDSVLPAGEQQSALRREIKKTYMSECSKQFPNLEDPKVTLASPSGTGSYIPFIASGMEGKTSSDTTRPGHTKEHKGKRHNPTPTNGSSKESALLQISGSDTDEVDGPRTEPVPSSSFPTGKNSPRETILGRVPSGSPLSNTQEVSAIPRTPPDGSYRANYIDSGERLVIADNPNSATFIGHHLDSKNDTVPGEIYSVHEARRGVSVCGIHGSLLHVYCKRCEEWACDGCLGLRHQQPPRGQCQIISAPDAVMHMKMSHTEFLSSNAETLEHFREELGKLVTECDNSIKEHEANVKHLEMQLREEVTLLRSIESMKSLAQQKLKKIDYWEDLLGQNASRIRQSSSSEEIQSAVFINRSTILTNIIEGVSIPELTIDSF